MPEPHQFRRAMRAERSLGGKISQHGSSTNQRPIPGRALQFCSLALPYWSTCVRRLGQLARIRDLVPAWPTSFPRSSASYVHGPLHVRPPSLVSLFTLYLLLPYIGFIPPRTSSSPLPSNPSLFHQIGFRSGTWSSVLILLVHFPPPYPPFQRISVLHGCKDCRYQEGNHVISQTRRVRSTLQIVAGGAL